jgi:Uma2 family endonuclease
MGMPALSAPTYWTAAMVRELPDDGNRYECIDGELFVTPSPANLHQSVVGALYRVIFPYLRDTEVGYAQVAPLDVAYGDGLVQPDLLAFRLAPATEGRRFRAHDLLLFVEVLSPSTALRDRGAKREFYARIGVPEYWIVHPASRLVERWRSGAGAPVWEDGVMTWHPEGAASALAIDLPALFAAVPDLPDRIQLERPDAPA